MKIRRWTYAIVFIILSLTYFACSNEVGLPMLNIIKEGEIKRTVKEACEINYAFNHDFFKMPGKIRRRGGVSTMYAKRSYSINLEGKYSIAGLPMDDDWILNASYIDKTFMRHKISYDLFQQMNAKNKAPKCAYVNVSVNDNNQGLYVLMEKINSGMLGLNKNDSLAMLFKGPPIFYKEKLSYVQAPLNYYHQKFPKKNKKINFNLILLKSKYYEVKDKQNKKYN